jgi:hypothetical protein
MFPRLVLGNDMPRQKNLKKIAAVILAAIAFIIALGVIYYVLQPQEKKFYSAEISPGQTYTAFDGNSQPLGYVFHAIRYNMYNASGSIIYGSGTSDTSWTCPEYVYGQEGNLNYTVNYAVAWTEATHTP